MEEVRIDRVRLEHLEPIRSMCRALVDHLQEGGHEAPFVWENDRVEDDMFGPHRCLDGFVAIVNDKPIGYVLYTTCYDIEAQRREVQALDLYVAPDCRGGKPSIAYLLMDRVLAYAKHVGAGQLSGYIYKGNPIMEKFCAKFGFAISDKYLSIKMPIKMTEVRAEYKSKDERAAA